VIDNFVYSFNDYIFLWVVTCSWFGFNAMIVTHLFELTIEFSHTPIVKDNKLRLQVTFQPGVMKKSWMDVAALLVASTISNQPVARSIIVSASKEYVLAGVPIVNVPTISTYTMTQGYSVRFCYSGWEHPIFSSNVQNFV
jgi:hypothetical protein